MAVELKLIQNDSGQAQCVAVLENFLEMAKTGKLISVAVTGLDTHRVVHREFARGSHDSGMSDIVSTVAALQDLAMRTWTGP